MENDQLTVVIQNNYNTYSFGGSKALVLSTSSWTEGKNNWDIWILAITISQVLKNAITILLIGNLPLQLLIQHIHALIYVSCEARPTGRRRILIQDRIAPVQLDKAEQLASILLHSSLRPNPNPSSFRGEPGVSDGSESRCGWRRRLEVVATETNPNLASTGGDGGTLMAGSSGLAPPCASTASTAMEDSGSRYPFCILRLHVVNTVGDQLLF